MNWFVNRILVYHGGAARQLRRGWLVLMTTTTLVGVRQSWGQAAPPRNARLDSLEARLPFRTRPDTNRVNTLNELVWENRDSRPRRAMSLAAEALALGQRLGFRRGIAKTYVLRGIIYDMTSHPDAAIADFEACRQQRAALGDWDGVAGAISNIGEVQVEQGRYAEAATNFVKALPLEQRYGRLEHEAAIFSNLGNVYFEMGQYAQALAYQQRYLRLPERVKDAHNEAQAFQLIGQVFEKLGRVDSALSYFRRATAVSHAQANWHGEALARLGMGHVLLSRGNDEAGEQEVGSALSLARRVDDKRTEAAALVAQSQLLLRQQRGGAARAGFERAYQLSRQTKTRYLTRDALAGLFNTARQQADYQAAAAYAAQLTALKDSLLTEASTRQIAELQTQYETKRKEADNRLQAAQLLAQQQTIRRRNAQLLAGGAGLLLLGGAGYAFYARRRRRREAEFVAERQRLLHQRTAAVLEAEETERRRIGADLHDGVGQLLTAARQQLSVLAQELDQAPSPARAQLLDAAQGALDESFAEVRGISHNLVPNALLRQGLGAAVREFLRAMSAGGGLRAEVEVVGLDARLPPALESTLFRVIQELSQNVVKHARASQISLQIVRDDDELRVLVEDNGVGFDPVAARGAAGPGGIGLANVETRLAYLGGRAYFDAAPGRGTVVTLTVPLNRGEAVMG